MHLAPSHSGPSDQSHVPRPLILEGEWPGCHLRMAPCPDQTRGGVGPPLAMRNNRSQRRIPELLWGHPFFLLNDLRLQKRCRNNTVHVNAVLLESSEGKPWTPNDSACTSRVPLTQPHAITSLFATKRSWKRLSAEIQTLRTLADSEGFKGTCYQNQEWGGSWFW